MTQAKMDVRKVRILIIDCIMINITQQSNKFASMHHECSTKIIIYTLPEILAVKRNMFGGLDPCFGYHIKVLASFSVYQFSWGNFIL